MRLKRIIKRLKIISRANFSPIFLRKINLSFPPQIIAHRGLKKRCREHTRQSLINVANHSEIAGVEIDVRMTKDLKLVLLHDPTIDRTSSGMGGIKDLTLAELENYNFNTLKHPESILTLEEALTILKDKLVVIDLKNQGSNEQNEYYLKEILNQVSDSQTRVIFITLHKGLEEMMQGFTLHPVVRFNNSSKTILSPSQGHISVLASNVPEMNDFPAENIFYRKHGLLKGRKKVVLSISNLEKLSNKRLILISDYPVQLATLFRHLTLVRTKKILQKEVAYEQGF